MIIHLEKGGDFRETILAFHFNNFQKYFENKYKNLKNDEERVEAI